MLTSVKHTFLPLHQPNGVFQFDLIKSDLPNKIRNLNGT
jgi:hypothetical protein